MDLVVHPSCQPPLPLPRGPPSSWVSPKSISKAPELSLLQTPQVVKVNSFMLLWGNEMKREVKCMPTVCVVLSIHSLLNFCTFHAFVLPASSRLGCFRPRVLSLHSPVHPAQQPQTHTCRHPLCFSRAFHHPTAPHQRESHHLYQRGRIPWTREEHPLDQWGKIKH